MVGWYVDIGFNESEPSTVKELNIIDSNRPFTITDSLSVEDNINSGYKNYIEVLAFMENDMGNSFSAFYPIFNITDTSTFNFDFLQNTIPSSLLAYPNFINYLKENPGKIGYTIHFKTLKKVLWRNGSRTSCFTVSDNGTLIKETVPLILWSSLSGNPNSYSIENRALRKQDFKNYDSYAFVEIQMYPSGNDSRYRARYGVVPSSFQDFLNFMFSISDAPDFIGPPPVIPDNPYEPGGPSGPGGGGGSFDDSSDQITDSTIPTISSANTGFTRIYNPTLSQVQDLARYLWTDTSVIETIWNHIKQFFENPMEAIIGFNLVPVPVPNGGTKNFALMYIDTGVSMTVAASQFVDVDCGTLELPEYYGSALDYSPNTKVSCFLPFIGNVSINTDEVMGRTLQVKYRVDICSGSCVAKIAVDGNFIYQYSGHCAINIPLSAADFSTYVNAAISVGKLVGTALAAGAGLAAASATEDAVQQTNQIVTTTQITNTARNPATGRQITTGTTTRVETREAPADQSSTQASFSGLSPQNIANTVGQVMTSKPHIEHSGGFSGNSGYLGVRRPYLIIERPNMCMPENFQTLNGFPSMITLVLGECKGFTRIQQVQLTGLHATNPEQAEILQLLKSGVIL